MMVHGAFGAFYGYRGSTYPNAAGFKTLSKVWMSEPRTSNLEYVDPLRNTKVVYTQLCLPYSIFRLNVRNMIVAGAFEYYSR